MEKQLRYQICFPSMSLAVYREVVAHLRQVQGVEAGLIPQSSQQFDYNQSQISCLWIQYADAITSAEQERVKQILAYYQNRYGTWEEETSPVVPSEM